MDNLNPNFKLGLYVRNSDPKQDTPEGTVKNQEQRLREFVNFKNMGGNFGEIVRIYVDRSISAKDMKRPELQKMLRDISSKKINAILVNELSRITRNMQDFVQIWDFLKEHKCSFVSLRENFDTTTAAGEMVMYSIANLAQFERRQTQERVTLSHKTRAQRGLYNGGTIPIGYKTIEGKKGYLEIDTERSPVVEEAFKAFLKFETLQATAKHLNNERKIKLDRVVQGGGNWARLNHFTIENLQHILRNKAYKGVREFKDGNKRSEAKAVWEPIINPVIFDRVQEILDSNYGKRKPFTKRRYPYLLSGLTYCHTCGDVMCGKSAHGKKAKYGYYEHSWATRRGSVLVADTLKCEPHRVSATKLEKAVLDNVTKLLSKPEFAKRIISDAHEIAKNDASKKKIFNIKKKISAYESHLEALAERLAQLPKNVPATLIFKQMEKLEGAKKEAQITLLELEKNHACSEMPTDWESYSDYLKLIKRTMGETAAPEVKNQIIKRLIHKVEVGVNLVRIHYYAGNDKISEGRGIEPSVFFKNECSNTLTNGAQD